MKTSVITVVLVLTVLSKLKPNINSILYVQQLLFQIRLESLFEYFQGHQIRVSTSFTSKRGLQLSKHVFWHSNMYSFDLFCIVYLRPYLFHTTLTHSLLKCTIFCLFYQRKPYNHCIY